MSIFADQAAWSHEPICPSCGYIFRHAWEMSFGAGLEGDWEGECGRCGKPLIITRSAIIRYETKLKPNELDTDTTRGQ